MRTVASAFSIASVAGILAAVFLVLPRADAAQTSVPASGSKAVDTAVLNQDQSQVRGDAGRNGIREDSAPQSGEPVTFNKQIAPIVWQKCTPCHRSGQVAPFPLLKHGDFQKRSRQIAEVTASRYMPPWLPEPGHGEFEGARRLSDAELGLIQQWIAGGAIEGRAEDRPSEPVWNEDWILGKPDLVVAMDKPYQLAPEGRDVYRNFVIPVPGTGRRVVRGLEFRPGNARIVHHAFVFVDATGRSRQLAQREKELGFGGMRLPDGARMPEGQFLSYQPGKMPMFSPDGMGWVLEPGTDLVLQVHLNPTGKPELLNCSVGLHFSDKPPTTAPFKIALTSLSIDILPGETNHVLADSFVLPVDVQAIGILPHAHYLAREMQGEAALPAGGRIPLLWIRDWDFKWQGDYRYSKPVELPRGTTVSMRFVYDNSTNNVRNPSRPPVRVFYGAQSADEMGELWLQLMVKNPAERPILARAYERKMQSVMFDLTESLLRRNPRDAGANLGRAKILYQRGQMKEAEEFFKLAVEYDPAGVGAHHPYGIFLLENSRFEAAALEFETVKKLDPSDSRGHGGLGAALMNLGRLTEAQTNFEAALRLNPRDNVARESLKLIRESRPGAAKGN